ncbi:MAG: 50S ribosomal protein L18 [Chloroflexia bacterium]
MKAKPHMLTPRAKRHNRVRARVQGTSERPRLNVFRSLNHIYAQVIDDSTGRTLFSASTLDKTVGEAAKIDEARAVGKLVAERARGAGISKVVFDRGGYLYHGRIKALAEGAREGGLDF